ncbi:MFS transporter [Candidatus Woesebacteria bacterium]|nr:MFS transporter [Candidatus Woesebacteria bacterium]
MKKELIPVLFLTFVNTLNFSIMIPILPFIVKQFGGGTIMYGLLLSIYPFFQFFAAPILGTLSDHFGRRPILLLSQAGTMLSWVIFLGSAFVPNIMIGSLAFPLLVIITARIADGITGGNNSVANAYLSDITSRDEKTKAFGMLGGVVGIGMVIGPAIGGLTMSSTLGFLAPVLLTLAVSVVTLIVMYQYLPESLKEENRKKELNFKLSEELQFLPKLKKYSQNRQIKYLLYLRTAFLFVFTSFSAIFVLFMIDNFQLTSQQIGLLFMLVGLFIFFNQVFVAGWLSKKVGDLKTFLIGQSALAISQLLYVVVPSLAVFFPVLYLNNLGLSLSMPTFKALLAKSVEENEQGEIMGIDESMFAASSAISPILATTVYSLIGKHTFTLQGLILLAAILIFELKKGWKKAV